MIELPTMPGWAWFVTGLFVGCFVGIFLLALVSAGRHDDEKQPKVYAKIPERDTIKIIVNKIQWVQEYVDAVGEEHKQVYIDGLQFVMEELKELID